MLVTFASMSNKLVFKIMISRALSYIQIERSRRSRCSLNSESCPIFAFLLFFLRQDVWSIVSTPPALGIM